MSEFKPISEVAAVAEWLLMRLRAAGIEYMLDSIEISRSEYFVEQPVLNEDGEFSQWACDVRLACRADIGALNEKRALAAWEATQGVLVRQSGHLFVHGESYGISWVLSLGRGVCERVQVGTVKKMIHDPALVAEIPLVEVEEPVLEWRCPDPIVAAGLTGEVSS